mgnify:FL=1
MLTNKGGEWADQPLPWHAEAFQKILATYRHQRLPHALMLIGPEGSGKQAFAATLTSALVCKHTGEGACGHCNSCELMRAGNHGDVRWLVPEAGKRAIGIEPVREAIRFMQQTAGYGTHKILAISPAEAMTASAANAILKTLEEPAGDSFVCLVCHRPGDLPATIRSRCQSLLLPAPSEDEALEWLTAQGNDRVQAHRALELTNGKVISALALLESDSLEAIGNIRLTIEQVLLGELAPGAGVSVLSKLDLDFVLDTVLAVLQARLTASDKRSLQQQQGLFELCDDVARWRAAIRLGLNLAYEGLLLHVFMRAGAFRQKG